MSITTKFTCKIISILVGTLLASSIAAGANYPSRAITVIVPYPAGGGTDMVARTLAHGLEGVLDVSVRVINHAGGAGITGSSSIANAKPDGYTIGLVASDISLYKPEGLADLSYADFTAIGQTEILPAGVTVNSSSPYSSVSELIAAIKANPGELKATGGAPGVNWHIAFIGFMRAIDLPNNDVTWVPIQGGAPSLLDVASGNSDFATASLVEGRALINAGKLRPLAIMSDKRTHIFPDVPTLKELGINWTFSLWHGVVAPKNLSEEVRKVLINAVNKVVNSKSFRSSLEKRGFIVKWRGGKDFRDFMEKDLNKMSRLLESISLEKAKK